MAKTVAPYHLSSLLLWILLFLASPVQAKEKGDDVLDRIIQLSKSKDTVYRLLGEISAQSDYLFIYDSKVLENEKVVKIKGGKYSIRQAIYLITGNETLDLRVVGNHILITVGQPIVPASVTPPLPQPKDTIPYITLQGILLDRQTRQPIEAGTVGVMNTSVGSVTNSNGEFRLSLPDSLRNSFLYCSHLGYEQQKIEIELLAGRSSTIALEPKVISLQEVVIRMVNPLRLLRDMREKRKQNYSQSPVYLTSFYREGIERKNKFVSLTEAVFKIYKSPYLNNPTADQVKLLKMRRISNRQERDTVITKMKSGIDASLMLDMMKDLPDFLTPDENSLLYSYAPTDLTVIDNRIANVIYFEQKEHINGPLYQGELYIDSENSALLRARFEINPKYINQAAGMLVEKKSRNLTITPQKVVYTVSYKSWNGIHYINHVRGDLYFKMKRRKQLFGTFPLHAWFEMVTCKIETGQVSRFTRNETLSTRTVFSETNFGYDKDFWGNFNIIPPEEKLNEAIGKISSMIEETGY